MRKLIALDYPHATAFDASDAEQLRTLIVWLEETKIRHLPISERGPLRALASPEWPAAFASYLAALQCPHACQPECAPLIVDWLLTRAISLVYHDHAIQFNALPTPTTAVAPLPVGNVPERLSTSSPEFRAALEALANALRLPTNLDTDVLLKGVCDVVESKFSKQAMSALPAHATPAALCSSTSTASAVAAASSSSSSSSSSSAPTYAMGQDTLGFSTGDAAVDRAATLLRLLYVADLRDTQSQVNDVIAALQERSANPRVDSALGRVGV